MIRNPRDLKRYTASERANHWAVGISFILLAISGLAFFHPAFFPLTQLMGGAVWARILHPYIGVIWSVSFGIMVLRFWRLNVLTSADKAWLKNIDKMVDGDDHDMPAQGKYNGGQKLLFWLLVLCLITLSVSGVLIWEAWFHPPIEVKRFASVIHAGSATVAIGLIIVHVYAAIWTKGTIRAMWYGTVTRAWAKQHHRNWYRQVTGDDR